MSLDELSSYLLDGGAYASKSGQNIGWQTALRVSTVLACAVVVADGLAQIPLKLYHRSQNGNRGPAEDHPAYDLLNTAPNDYQTSFEFMQTIGIHLMICGNAYVWKNYVRGRLAELLILDPSWISLDRNGWETTYTVTTDEGLMYTLGPNDVWHIRDRSWNGWRGMDAVSLAREAIGLAMATEEHGSRLFKNGATVGGILSTDQDLKQAQRDELRASWNARHGGSENAFSTAVLWGGMKWHPMGADNEKTQYLELRKHQVEEICTSMGVLPIMVGHADKTATYASAEAMFKAHQVKTMQPKYRMITTSADKALLTPEERRQGYYFKFTVNALMYANAKDRAEYWWKLWQMGAITPNEIREFDEKNPYPDGNDFFRPANTIPVDAVDGAETGTVNDKPI